MGSGKSAVGQKLAGALGIEFQDLDRWIEKKTRMSIPVIFKVKGEKYFRNKEREGIRTLTRKSSLIIATGGGTWMDPLNRRRLNKWGTVVWLKVGFATVWRRVAIQKARRPLVGLTINPSPEFLELYQKRQKIYSQAAFRVLTDNRTPAQSCKLLLKKLKSVRSPE